MPKVAQDRSFEAHRETVETSLQAMVNSLQDSLGARLLAYVAGVSDPKAVSLWAKGLRSPRRESEERIRLTYQVFQLLLVESAHTVRGWFVGLNPQLDDQSPAEAIREGRLRDVLVAAKSYVAGG